MAIYQYETGTRYPGFLDSAEGLVLKTVEIPQSLGNTDGTHKIVVPGTPYPANTASCTGLVYEAVDVTDGAAIGAVVVAGRVIADRVTLADAAKTALTGITFVAANETTRPNIETED